MVCLLHHAMYGPKQSPLTWFAGFNRVIFYQGFDCVPKRAQLSALLYSLSILMISWFLGMTLHGLLILRLSDGHISL